ncbi:MAG: DinB family protein [bacterium]|nr:DinB family protein [bacterium]
MTTSFRALPPADTEFAAYYRTYTALVPAGDILKTMSQQQAAALQLISTISESEADFAYAPGKWSIKEVLGHVTDGERVFAYRALRIARGDETPLPGFDENKFAASGGHAARTLESIALEFDHLRTSSLDLFASFDETAWLRKGTASGHPVSVRAMAWIIAGHLDHHLKIIRERYLKG